MSSLDGIKVVDLSRVLGGPFCTQLLGDHGATVIKVEPPQGDETRLWGPPFSGDAASYFLGLNRNKLGMALDLSSPEGREILLMLLNDADVLVENFKPGTMEKWGLGYEQLGQRFPRLIHCRVSGFGADGPLGGLPGYDAVIQAMCGLMSVNGEKGGAPLRMGIPVVDIVTGMNAALAVLLALQARVSSGCGQFVEATLYDSGLSLMHPHLPNYFLSGKAAGRSGNAHPNIAPYDSFPTRTNPIFLAVGNDGQFARMCRLLGDEAMAGDSRFASNADRLTNVVALRQGLESLLASHDGNEMASRLMASGVPCGPVMDAHQAITHPHAVARSRVVRLGSYTGVASPISMSRTPATYKLTPPSFGEHSGRILDSLGFDARAISRLAAAGVIPDSPVH